MECVAEPVITVPQVPQQVLESALVFMRKVLKFQQRDLRTALMRRGVKEPNAGIFAHRILAAYGATGAIVLTNSRTWQWA
jgi:hypothetical protein